MRMQFSIPTVNESVLVDVEQGSSVIFVGANGSGKSRLAIYIETSGGESAHRISAHRALNLNTDVPKIKEEFALRKLRYGAEWEGISVQNRESNRWGSKASSMLLNDFDFLIQALFAEQSRTALESHNMARRGMAHNASPTKFEKLEHIWSLLLPHRQLIISGDEIDVQIPLTTSSYKASEMSDGERAIFYLIGQVLVAAENSLIIIDEPELHVHRSIMSSLWDQLESSRPDCAFVFITHDLEFASSRVAKKYAIKEYQSTGPIWGLESIPSDTGFSEELTTLILGSRRPILFVEGGMNSLDKALYRSIYPEWTIIPRGSCQDVVHAVVTLRANQQLTRIHCAGIVDADDHNSAEIEAFSNMGVHVLPVSEIENLFILPIVSREIAFTEHFSPEAVAERLELLLDDVLLLASSQGGIEESIQMYCKRRIDRILKKIDLSNTDSIEDIKSSYIEKTQGLDIDLIASERRNKLDAAIQNRNIEDLLSLFDNKGMLAKAASRLKGTGKSQFENWLVRILTNDADGGVVNALRRVLPTINIP